MLELCRHSAWWQKETMKRPHSTATVCKRVKQHSHNTSRHNRQVRSVHAGTNVNTLMSSILINNNKTIDPDNCCAKAFNFGKAIVPILSIKKMQK
jgi:hypothetical protein